MPRINALCVVCAMSAWALGAWAPGARGGSVQATLANPKAFAPLGATGGFNVNAYSEEDNPLLGGPVKNTTVTSSVVTNGIAINPSPPNQRNKPGYYVGSNSGPIPVPTGKGKSTALGPTARLIPNRAPLDTGLGKASFLKIAGDQATITSTTDVYQGEGSAFVNPVGERLLFARALKTGPTFLSGKAGGQATDPFFVPSSGSPLTYDPVLNDSIQLGVGESGGAVAWTSDSSVFTSDSMDNFDQDGAPLDQTLWYLAISGQGPIASTSDVGLDFELNPLALNEIAFPSSFLAGLGSYSDAASEAALIDQSIDQRVAGALTLNGNEVDLNGFDPFPTGTTFSAVNGGVEYADGVDAGISGDGFSSTPAPHAWLLFATGFLGFLGTGWRRKKLSTT